MGNVENHGSVGNQTVININNMSGNIGVGVRTSRMPDVIDKTYYNLFVVDDDTFRDKDYIVIPKSSALIASMEPEDIKQFATLRSEARARIKTFPSLFASVNHDFAQTDESHFAILGCVSDIEVRNSGIFVCYYPFPLAPIKQQRLNEITSKLRIEAASSFNEFDRVHWSIKRLDLIETLKLEGFELNVFA